jgi:hypothetical protein
MHPRPAKGMQGLFMALSTGDITVPVQGFSRLFPQASEARTICVRLAAMSWFSLMFSLRDTPSGFE